MTGFALLVGLATVSCAFDRCHVRICNIACVVFAVLTFLGLCSWFIPMGAILIAPYSIGSEWVEDNCAAALKNETVGSGFDPQH